MWTQSACLRGCKVALVTFVCSFPTHETSNCLPDDAYYALHSHIGCICFTFLQCAFSNVTSYGLPEMIHSRTGYICWTLDEFPKKKLQMSFAPPLAFSDIYPKRKKEPASVFWPELTPPHFKSRNKKSTFLFWKKITEKSQMVKYRWTAHMDIWFIGARLHSFQNKTREIPRIHKLQSFR